MIYTFFIFTNESYFFLFNVRRRVVEKQVITKMCRRERKKDENNNNNNNKIKNTRWLYEISEVIFYSEVLFYWEVTFFIKQICYQISLTPIYTMQVGLSIDLGWNHGFYDRHYLNDVQQPKSYPACSTKYELEYLTLRQILLVFIQSKITLKYRGLICPSNLDYKNILTLHTAYRSMYVLPEANIYMLHYGSSFTYMVDWVYC